LIIGLSGMPYAGKSVFAIIAEKSGIPNLLMRSIIEDEMRKKGIKIDNINLHKYSSTLRKQFGHGVVAERSVPGLNKLLEKNRIVILDSLRSPEEVKILKEKYNNFMVVTIWSSQNNRFLRFGKKRPGHTSDELHTIEELVWRDSIELSWGLGEIIALADMIIVNEDSKNSYKKKVGAFLKELFKINI